MAFGPHKNVNVWKNMPGRPPQKIAALTVLVGVLLLGTAGHDYYKVWKRTSWSTELGEVYRSDYEERDGKHLAIICYRFHYGREYRSCDIQPGRSTFWLGGHNQGQITSSAIKAIRLLRQYPVGAKVKVFFDSSAAWNSFLKLEPAGTPRWEWLSMLGGAVLVLGVIGLIVTRESNQETASSNSS